MNIKLKIIKIQLESLRNIMHILLKFKKPTDKIVISCSQQLDKVIVKYYEFKLTSDNRAFFSNTELIK